MSSQNPGIDLGGCGHVSATKEFRDVSQEWYVSPCHCVPWAVGIGQFLFSKRWASGGSPSPTPIYTACQPWSQLFDFLCRFHLPHISWRLIIVNDLYFVVWFSWRKTAPTPPAGAHTSVIATWHSGFVLLLPSHALASTGEDWALCLLFSLPSLNTWQNSCHSCLTCG